MLGHYWYHESLKRYTAVFGTLFNDIKIPRKLQDGTVVKDFKVPLAYGPAEKYLARNEADPELNRVVAIELPRMAFEITGMTYAADRKLATTQRLRARDPLATDQMSATWQAVPYDINIQLNIMVKSYDDGCAILEQILPYFTPDWTPTVKLVDSMALSVDTPIVLVGVSNQDTYEGDFKERRHLIWTLDFVLKGTFLGPVLPKKIIKVANTNFRPYISQADNTLPFDNVNIRPGLTANGEPTTDPTESVPYGDIDSTDNWDYIITIENVGQ